MSVVVTTNCDRCGGKIREVKGNEPIQTVVDLEVRTPWVSTAAANGWDPVVPMSYTDLCDSCRNAIVGYLASIFKVDRAVLNAGCKGTDGGALKGEGALPLGKGKPKGSEPENAEEVRRLAAAGEPLIDLDAHRVPPAADDGANP